MTRITKYDSNHQFLVHDQNGFARTSATTKQAALNRARLLAESTGLDMQVVYLERSRLIGTVNRITWVRTQSQALRSRRFITTNGWTLVNPEVRS